MNIAMILAGGKGLRMNCDTPKQFINVNQKPLIIHTLQRFEKCEKIDGIIVVCLYEYADALAELCKSYGINKVKWIAPNGSTRHESVISGLSYLKNAGVDETDAIIIHNANMPFVTEENIHNCLEQLSCNGYDLVTTIGKCQEYFLCKTDGDDYCIGPDRNTLVTARVPEVILLKDALSLYSDPMFCEKKYESFTASMLGITKGLKVGYVFCDSTNIKITTKSDLKLFSAMLEAYDR